MSILGNLVQTMAAGTWAKLSSSSLTDAMIRPFAPSYSSVFNFANSGTWDPVNRKAYYLGGTHGATYETRFLLYDDATNTWSLGTYPFPLATQEHGYDHITTNPDNGDVYYHLSGSTTNYRYRAGAWTTLAPATISGFVNFAAGQRYFREMGRLVLIQGDQVGVWDYNPTSNTWGNAIVPGGDPGGTLAGLGAYQFFVVYSQPKQLLFFGGGSGGGNAIFKMTPAGVITRVANSPVAIDINGDNVEADPVTGNLILLRVGNPGDPSQTMYEYQVDTNQWVNLTSTRNIKTPKLFNISHNIDYDPAAIIIQIPTYNVLMVVAAFSGATPEVWVYKHANAEYGLITDETYVYNQWGWSYTQAQLDTALQSSPYTGTISNIDVHHDLENDDLWSSITMFQRTNRPEWQRFYKQWYTYYSTKYQTEPLGFHNDDSINWTADHVFGWGLLDYWNLTKDAVALTTAVSIGNDLHTYWDARISTYRPGQSDEGYRGFGRALRFVTRLWQARLANGDADAASWRTFADAFANRAVAWPINETSNGHWHQQGTGPDGTVAAAPVYTRSDAASYGKTTSTYGTNMFHFAYLNDALWKYWVATGSSNNPVRAKLLAMANWAYLYGMDPTWHHGHSYPSLWVDSPSAGQLDWGYTSGASTVNPNTTVYPIDAMIRGYLLTSNVAYLNQAKFQWERASKVPYGARADVTYNNAVVGGGLADTQGFMNSRWLGGGFSLNLNGELQYASLLFPTWAQYLGGSPSTPAQNYGLEWDGSGSVRRMLYWNNPFPIYPATYVFRVYPRRKNAPVDSPTGYYTTFFWGNNGIFTWDAGSGNTYYGFHPYPVPPTNGPGQWEISINGNDFTTGVEVTWDRWYTQVMRVRRVNATTTEHEFYYDWPDQSKVLTHTINNSNWAATNPPVPAIVVGQAPDEAGPPPANSGNSWGGFPGWEEFNGIIRGMQFYTSFLSIADITAEVTSPKSSTAGAAAIWYLNLDPRPTDVTDKKATGTPHNPVWFSTTAAEWSGAIGSTPPSAPTGLRIIG